MPCHPERSKCSREAQALAERRTPATPDTTTVSKRRSPGTAGAIIDGKKYELQSYLGVGDLLALGDYKAKLIQNDQKTTYDSYQAYEFLFPDKKTRRFDVIGQIE